MISKIKPCPLMVLGTSSGAGKSLMTSALCRVLKRKGESPLPFKGQNMSNNAWVDRNGGEMAYSQAVQAWAAGLEPLCAMNPILLKPKGDCISEVIHLGKSVGFAKAQTYYQDWFKPGWVAINQALNDLTDSNKRGRLVLEGAGSPVEINLQHRDLTNLRLAKFLGARCLLVADIERGGVFAQVIGTLALMSPVERALVKGLIINRFRGDSVLFQSGRDWLQQKTGIPVIGVMPWIKEIFPPEDSLDLLERNSSKPNAEIKISIIKLPSLSNFSDFDPLEAEPTVQLVWIEPGDFLGEPDAVIIPGSKQTLRDLEQLNLTDLGDQIKSFAKKGGIVFGICGGLQMIGNTLEDPFELESTKRNKDILTIAKGLNLLPIRTIFEKEKTVKRRTVIASWPEKTTVSGYELHHGKSHPLPTNERTLSPILEDQSLGWMLNDKNRRNIAGTYLHGIFENGEWRRLWINLIRKKKGLSMLNNRSSNHVLERERAIDLLADKFEEHIDITTLLKA